MQNGDTEIIPPHGVVQNTGAVTSDGVMIVSRPASPVLGNIYVNDHAAIPVSSTQFPRRGMGTRSPQETIVAYHNDVDGVLPAPGDTWGPRNGSWFLHRGYAGFVAIGSGGLGSQVANFARQPPLNAKRMQLLQSLPPCGSAQAIEMRYSTINGNYCNFGQQFVVYDSVSIVQTVIEPGNWLWAILQPDSARWEVDSIGSEGCCGGSGSGSGSMSACITTIGGVDFTKLQMVDPHGGPILIPVLQDGCWALLPTNLCPGSGSGS